MSIDAVTISKAAKYNLRPYRFYDLPNEELQNDILTLKSQPLPVKKKNPKH